MVNNKTMAKVERQFMDRIEELSPIVNGLKNYEPFNKLVDIWKKNNIAVDSSWHNIYDLAKLNEYRITKFATMALVNVIPDMENELEKLQDELIKLRNPEIMIQRDVDNE